MKTRRIEFQGITKAELHNKITSLLDKYDEEIKKNNISVEKSVDIYNISGSIKKFVFTFSVKAEVELNDNFIDIRYETDVPENYHDSGIESLTAEIKSI